MINLSENIDIYIPDGAFRETALERITHLGIGAHPDDLEIMAIDGILKCYNGKIPSFGGITCTNGSGGVLANQYATLSRENLKEIRKQEQKNAALVGRYSAVMQLGFNSSDIMGKSNELFERNIKEILLSTKPKVIYTHNPVDKHATHLAVLLTVVKVLRSLASEYKPQEFYGAEVWRDLDWLSDTDKIRFDVSAIPHISQALICVYDAQISSGKRFDKGTLGRRFAHATFDDGYASDGTTALAFGLDLMPLLGKPYLGVADFVGNLIDRFKKNALSSLNQHEIL
ncbi:MAG: PIG-L family deacetylase [Deltaproteobacteria bacterium]|nr:PIG-L family deacetylase [Deltaproteobacteria bacterium]